MNIDQTIEKLQSPILTDDFENKFINFRALFEATPSPYLILNSAFTIIGVNDAYLTVSQTERDQILGKYIFDVFPDDPDDPEAKGVSCLHASLDKVIRTLKPDIMPVLKYNIRSPEGRFLERYWRPANFPVLDDRGKLVYIIHYVEDVTTVTQMRERASQSELMNLQLKELQVFLESILENIPNMVFVKDARDLKYIKFNKAGEELLGYTQEELKGKNDYDFFPKEEADFFTAKDRDVFTNRKVVDIPEEPIHTRYKGERILHTKKVPLFDEQGNPLYLIGISEDITEKINVIEARLAQKSAEEMAKRKIAFLDIAAHELRTPITSLLLLLQLAEKQVGRGKEISPDLLARLRGPANRLSRLVIDLLDMSRIERGLMVLLSAPTDIVNLVEKCLDDFRILAPTRNFVFVKPENSLTLEVDALRIHQVLSNLIDNAVKYTTNSVEVKLEDIDEFVIISVIDHGPGIPKEQLKSLFTAFTRGNSNATIRASGLGLGLSVCKGIIDLHGGSIDVDCKEGKGCVFSFRLPKKKVPQSNEATKTSSNSFS
jgi:PAS domain S-box-containing protein